MPEHFDPTMIAIALLLWPLIKSIVFLVALTVCLRSEKESRRLKAERVLRLMCGGSG